MTADTYRHGDYEIRSFRAGRAASGADERTRAWLEAAALPFLAPAPSGEHMTRLAESYQSYDKILTGAYPRSSPPDAWAADRPVATYATFVQPMNVGHGTFLDAHLIADVTVRATHRRRGLLRAVISADLRRAAAAGLTIAALRPSEATIYGRFGFGPAIFTRRIQLDTGAGFGLRHAPTGCVEVTEPTTLLRVAPVVFDHFHARTVGSIQRQPFYPKKIAGIWAEDRPLPDPGVRAAVHYDLAGRLDGYVTYRLTEHQPAGTAIEVIDIVGADQNAYFGLWEYLASIDLISLVEYRQAPAADPLSWALVDCRGLQVVRENDALWLRLLDPVAALGARGYDVDGEVRISVSDPLGICGGVYHLRTRGGIAAVTTVDSSGVDADIRLDIASLSSLYLGGVRARVLARAGCVTARSSTVLDDFDALFACEETPYCITQF